MNQKKYKKLNRAQLERKHRRGVEALVERLLEKNYDMVIMNPFYKIHDLAGEFDVLAIRGTHYHYYEVKCHDTRSSYNHARHQIHRAQRAFPNVNLRGIYYTLDGRIKRIK